MVKIMHQVWIQGEAALPQEFRNHRQKWRDLLPPDWTMKLWDEAAATAQWPDYGRISPLCFHHATRADIILARAQRDFGGMSMGTDVVPVNVPSLLRWLEINGTLVVVNIGGQSASNGVSYFAEPGHPFISCVCQHQLRNEQLLADTNVWKSTGPGCWYEALKAHMWNLSLATDDRAYTVIKGGKPENPAAWVDPGMAGSWHT